MRGKDAVKNGSTKKKIAQGANTKNGPKKSHKHIIISALIGVVVLAIVAIVLFFILKKDPDINTEKIVTRLSEKIPSITNIINYSEANDPNGIMGQENQYTSKSSWGDTRIEGRASEFAGTIEVFRNTKDAELREWKINKIQEACELRITEEKYGSSVKQGWGCQEYKMYRKDAVVIRLSTAFDDDQIEEYKKHLNDILEKFVTPDKDTPSAERINEIRRETEATVESVIDASEKDLQKGLDDILATYENTLDGIAVSLKEDELNDAKAQLDFFKEASYYSSKIAGLEQKIKNIENKIASEKKRAQEESEKAEREKLAKKNKNFGAGKYTVCTDIDSGTYDATVLSGSGNLFVHSDYTSHYVNELMSVNGAYGWNKEYKNITLSCGDILELTSSLKIRFTAK